MVSVKFFLAATLALLPATVFTNPVPAEPSDQTCKLAVKIAMQALPEDQRNILMRQASLVAALIPGLEMDANEMLAVWACSHVDEGCKDSQSAGLCYSMNNLQCHGSVGDQSCQAQASGDCNDQYC